MPRRTNPFTPTFGSVPATFVGRDEMIDDVMEGLADGPGDPNRSTIFIGARGSGKTALLRTIAREASQQGWVSVSLAARSGFFQELFDGIKANAAHLITQEGPPTVKAIQLGPVGIERELAAKDVVSNRFRLQYVIEDLNSKGVGLLVLVDEIDPTCEEFIDFISAYQQYVSEERDVALIMAGLPSRVSSLFQDRSVSFIRRAFQRHLGPIDRFAVEEALFNTIVTNGKTIDADALDMAARSTQGFALAIQLVGYYLWRESHGRSRITVQDAQAAARRTQRELINAVVVPTLQELTPREQEYLVAMAQDDGPSSTGDVAHRMGVGMTNASNLRRRLIERGVIKVIRMGQVAFEMPGMRECLRSGIDHEDMSGYY